MFLNRLGRNTHPNPPTSGASLVGRTRGAPKGRAWYFFCCTVSTAILLEVVSSFHLASFPAKTSFSATSAFRLASVPAHSRLSAHGAHSGLCRSSLRAHQETSHRIVMLSSPRPPAFSRRRPHPERSSTLMKWRNPSATCLREKAQSGEEIVPEGARSVPWLFP
eukprot:3918440-Rhodomonas_salina.1